MKKLLPLLLLVTLVASCRKMKDPELRGIENVRIGAVGLAGTVVDMDLRYYNPNSKGGILKNASGDAWVDSTFLGRFIVDSVVNVPANQEFLIPVKLTLDMKNMLKNAKEISKKKEVWVRVEGSAKAGRNGFFKTIPLRYAGMQDLSELFK